MRLLWFVCFVTVALLMICEPTIAEENGALTIVEVEEDDGFVEDAEDSNGASPVDFSNPDVEPFVPTKEFQEVKPGQSIPSGLHVQLNLETGKKEAKLMEGDDGSRYLNKDDKPKSTDDKEPSRLQKVKQAVNDYNMGQSSKSEPLKFWTDGIKQGMANTKKDSFTRDELKEALKKFKTTTRTNLKEDQASIKDKFRSADELLSDMKEIDASLKMDSELIRELLERYQTEQGTAESKQAILTDLEYYVHQIDNAMDFVKMGGMTLAVKELNHTDTAVRCEAAYVVGSAVQSNPTVQMEALEAGAMHQLIRMFSAKSDEKLQNRVMYAVSALLRHYPEAQIKFVELGGIQMLTQILAHGSQKMKMKAVTLINDLIDEKVSTEELMHKNNSPALKEKNKQYNVIHLDQNIKDQGWCLLITDLLELPEHDSREKVITAMHTLMQTCQDEFLTVIPSLRALQEQYRIEADEEIKDNDDDFFFRDLLESVNKILQKLGAYRRNVDL